MAATTGPIIAAGAITVINRWLFNNKGFDARILIATGLLGGGLALMERADAPIAKTISWAVLISVLFIPMETDVDPPIVSAAKWFGAYKTPGSST